LVRNALPTMTPAASAGTRPNSSKDLLPLTAGDYRRGLRPFPPGCAAGVGWALRLAARSASASPRRGRRWPAPWPCAA
jgi:hypothetical protein